MLSQFFFDENVALHILTGAKAYPLFLPKGICDFEIVLGKNVFTYVSTEENALSEFLTEGDMVFQNLAR